jgi:hypothetical protein
MASDCCSTRLQVRDWKLDPSMQASWPLFVRCAVRFLIIPPVDRHGNNVAVRVQLLFIEVCFRFLLSIGHRKATACRRLNTSICMKGIHTMFTHRVA